MTMLGRTAANLFWLSRYVERAENTARLLETGYRMSLTGGRERAAAEYLTSMMKAASVEEAFKARHEVADLANVAYFMLFDTQNPSSVHSCLRAARTNARAERTSLTSDMWESLNSSWIAFSQIKPAQTISKQLPELLSWVKRSSHQFQGALLSTVLRTDGYAFGQLGNFTERADNTARILDMKYYVLLPRATFVGGDVDIQQWALILRAASAYRSYRHVYHDRFKAWNIADYLILRPEMPRSLLYCARWIAQICDMLEMLYGERTPAHEAAAELAGMLDGNDMDRIFQFGLHEFLVEFIGRNTRFTDVLSESYNFY